MLVLETVLRIRREHAAGKAIKAIMRDLHLSRGVVRKAVRSPEADMSYRREVQPLPKLGPFQARLDALLEEDEARPRREKLRITRIHDLLLREGFDGSYDAVRRYAARWRQARRRDVMDAPAFIPLLFRPGEAYQFDWSHEDVEIAGKPMRVKVAHVRLCASRVIYVRAYAREIVGHDPQGRETDRLAIHEEQAALVRRIFQRYAAGDSLKKICKALNDEKIPSPRASERGKYNAGIWNPSTLSGDPALGEGILNNELYIGRRIFNRRTWVEVPNERRGFSRRPRLNPEAEWIVRDEPDLRIIDQPLWDAVKVRQSEARQARDEKFKLTANPLGGAKRPAHLLSGLVTCGICGGPFVGTGGRWRCKAAIRKACSNASIRIGDLENRVIAGLREKLLTPAVIAKFADTLQRELDEQYRAANADRSRLESGLEETRLRLAKVLRRIEEDDDAPRTLTLRLKELEAEEERQLANLARAPDRTVVHLPTNYEAVYRRAIDELEQHLASEGGGAARASIRQLVETVVVHAGDGRGGKVRRLGLQGDLFRMLEFVERAASGGERRARNAQQPRSVGTGAVCGTPLVAGTRFHLNLRPNDSLLTAVAASVTATPNEFAGLFSAAA